MIQALVDLSYRRQLTGSHPFAVRRVHWFIDLDAEGRFQGIVPAVPTSAAQGAQGTPDFGIEIEGPVAYFAMVRPHGVAATGGGGMAVAEPGAGNLAEIFGVTIEAHAGRDFRGVAVPEKHAYKRASFLDLHRQLAEAAPRNQTLQAVWKFLTARVEFPVASFSAPQLRKLPVQQFSFRVAGRLLLDEPDLRRWWSREFVRRRSLVVDNLPAGRDLFPHSIGDPCTGPLARVFPHVGGIPGAGVWCPLASFDKAPYQSFGLGKGTLPLRLESAERASAALNWLLQDPASHLRLGQSVGVFWSDTDRDLSQPFETVIACCLTNPDPVQVRNLLADTGTRQHDAAAGAGRLYAAILSSPQGRITVRSWRTAVLSRVRDNLRRWVDSLAVPAPYGEGEFYPSLGELAASTVRKSIGKRPLPGTYSTLFESALFGVERLPRRLLAQALASQARELAVGREQNTRAEFERRLAARTALFQALLQISPTDASHPAPVVLELSPAYLCGRLLAHLDRIHDLARPIAGSNDTSPATRAYAVACQAPAHVLPHLCQLARFHLQQIGGGLAVSLEWGRRGVPADGLRGIVGQLQDSASGFPKSLCLEDQARLALGFYTERRRWWARQSPHEPTHTETAAALDG